MRLIGTLESQDLANSFGDYLYLKDIENNVEEGSDGGWEIWVHDDDQLGEAQSLFAEFSQDTSAFEGLRRKAARERKRKNRRESAGQKEVVEGHQVWSGAGASPMGTLTMILVVVSCGFFLLAQMRGGGLFPSVLYIQGFEIIGGYRMWSEGFLPEVMDGQVWRLITPILMHGGWIHLIFNMMWLADLGGMVEFNKGSVFLGMLVLLVAAGSNLAQYVVGGPNFLGMSGVVYGLLGYAWMLSRYAPGKGIKLHQTTVTMMLVWLVLCFTGLMGPIANTAHLVGIVLGVVWGFLESGGIWRLRRRLG